MTFAKMTGSELWVRAWMYIPAAPVANNLMRLMAVEQTVLPYDGMGVFLGADKLQQESYEGGHVATSAGSAPMLNRWLCFEWKVTLSATSGALELSVDGLSQVPPVMGQTQPTPPVGQVAIGAYLFQQPQLQPAFDLYVDDVIIDDKPIGCDR
jgi:hypothetical protein